MDLMHMKGSTLYVDRLFQLDGAIGALNSHYWSMAIQKTDVLEIMPQKRRDEWHEMMRTRKCPDFDEQVVRDTLGDLMNSRYRFFAEKIDGVFYALSGDHVTNQPQGFYKRMIISRVYNEWGGTDWNRRGFVHDLRCAVARLENREEPDTSTTELILKQARLHSGEWVHCDGGRMKIRGYMVGTAHIEVHPEIAVMLNIVLASLHPTAIPASFRTKKPKPPKGWPVMQRPLPREVLGILVDARQAFEWVQEGYKKGKAFLRDTLTLPSTDNKHALREAETVLEAIGGVKQACGHFQFDYHPDQVVSEIVASGCIPDKKSHQFYPTPRKLAEMAISLAEIGQHDICLEPSAGTGGLADFMPKERTYCAEISELHCKVLTAKGFDVAASDFLKWDAKGPFDRIIMNPPFDQGRWQAHVRHAASMLARNGRLVAILPSGARKAEPLSDMACEWHGPFDNEFPDASVSVVILVAQHNLRCLCTICNTQKGTKDA
jgi:hypothetical protein